MKNLNAILMVSCFLIIIWILYSTASIKFSGDNKLLNAIKNENLYKPTHNTSTQSIDNKINDKGFFNYKFHRKRKQDRFES